MNRMCGSDAWKERENREKESQSDDDRILREMCGRHVLRRCLCINEWRKGC